MDKKQIAHFGGSSIEKELFDYIQSIIKPREIVLELGGGDGSTIALGSIFKLYTVEQDLKWMKYPELTNYIHCPLKGFWYDTSNLIKQIPKKLICF